MLSDGAKDKLLAYDFPGNARELENMIIAAVALAGDEHILSESALDVPAKTAGRPGVPGELIDLKGSALDAYIDAIEKKIITQALAANGGNVSKTARQLGLQRQTLQYKLRKGNL